MSAHPPLQPGQSASTPVPIGRGPSRSPARGVQRLAGRITGSRRVTRPGLRLTPAPPSTSRIAPRSTPMQGSTDPRWVLAVRTAEMLQGAMLSPERRERIVRMAKMFDLTPFDANMIIAIVQDQARRGIAPHLCPTAGEPQLRMITPPQRTTLLQKLRSRYGMKVILLIAGMLVVELLLIWWAV